MESCPRRRRTPEASHPIMSPALDREAWLVALEGIAKALGPTGQPVRLCLIGSVACVFGGMAARTTRDLDVWKPASDYDLAELKQAVEAAGLSFDPKSTLDPDKPYVQLVERGPTQVGQFEPVFMERLGRLHLYRPPVGHLIASKLVRGDDADIEDVVFLISKYQPARAEILAVIESFSEPGRTQALGNLIYFDVTDRPDADGQAQREGGGEMTAREQELIAREMLARPELLGSRLRERRWGDVAALVAYVERGVPKDLAMTDPALFKTLHDQITHFYLRGGGALSLAALNRMAARAAPPHRVLQSRRGIGLTPEEAKRP